MTTCNVEITDSLLARLKKLSNLADASKNDSAEEVASAAAKLSELMLRYNLSMDAILDVDEKPASVAEYISEYFTPTKNGHYVWWRDLMSGIISNNYCRELFCHKGSTHYMSTIIGQTHNVEFCKYLYSYVRAEIYRLSQVAYQKHKNSAVAAGYPTPHSWSYHSSFCRAAVATVVDRLRAQRLNLERTNESATAIVVVKGAELEQAIRKFAPHLYDEKKKQRFFNDHKDRRGKSRAGLIHGRQAGETINLNRPLENASSANGAKLIR